MKVPFRRLVEIVSIAVILCSCSNEVRSPEPLVRTTTALPVTSTPAPVQEAATIASTATTQQPGSRLEDARDKWQRAQISNYDIVIRFYENFANGLTTERKVSVRNGKVETSTCSPSGYRNLRDPKAKNAFDYCPAFVYREVFTIEDLFRVAGGSTAFGDDGDIDKCIKVQEFDERFGYPTHVEVDCPQAADEENSFLVTAFAKVP
jgi:hypothetical protein